MHRDASRPQHHQQHPRQQQYDTRRIHWEQQHATYSLTQAAQHGANTITDRSCETSCCTSAFGCKNSTSIWSQCSNTTPLAPLPALRSSCRNEQHQQLFCASINSSCTSRHHRCTCFRRRSACPAARCSASSHAQSQASLARMPPACACPHLPGQRS